MRCFTHTNRPTGGTGSAFHYRGLQSMDPEQERFWLLRRGEKPRSFIQRLLRSKA